MGWIRETRKWEARLADSRTMRVAFQGEPGAFSEAAAVQLLGEEITTVPRPTFEALFAAISEGAADALLAPVENSLAGSVVRVYDLLVESDLTITAETILPIEMNLIAMPGTSLADIRVVASHPMALAQCERFFAAHPQLKRTPAEDTAGSVREMMGRGDKSCAAIAAKRAARHYRATILAERIQDNAQNFTRFVLLIPAQNKEGSDIPPVNSTAALSAPLTDIMVELHVRRMEESSAPLTLKMSLALRLAHRPGALLAALKPFSDHGVNLLKIESRPIHGRPWEYQFFMDVETDDASGLQRALADLQTATSHLRVLGFYQAIRNSGVLPAK
jgi:prephenate dehydratase